MASDPAFAGRIFSAGAITPFVYVGLEALGK
jgi:hypothetical protein